MKIISQRIAPLALIFNLIVIFALLESILLTKLMIAMMSWIVNNFLRRNVFARKNKILRVRLFAKSKLFVRIVEEA